MLRLLSCLSCISRNATVFAGIAFCLALVGFQTPAFAVNPDGVTVWINSPSAAQTFTITAGSSVSVPVGGNIGVTSGADVILVQMFVNDVYVRDLDVDLNFFSTSVPLSAGDYTIRVTASTEAGIGTKTVAIKVVQGQAQGPTVSMSLPGGNAYVLDTQASAKAVTVTGNASAVGATVSSFQLYNNNAPIGAALPGGSSYSTTAFLGQGNHVLSMRVTDSGGSVGISDTQAVSVTVAAPTVTMDLPPSSYTLTGGATSIAVPISGMATAFGGAAVSSITILDNGIAVGSLNPTAGPFSGSVTLGSGPHSIWVRVTDSLGVSTTSNASPVTVGTGLPPTVSMSAPSSNATISLTGLNTTTTVTVAGSGAPSTGAAVATLEILNNGVPTGISSSSSSISRTISLPTGSHTLTLRITDSAGQTATSNPITITVLSSSGPTAVLSAPAANASIALTGLNTTTAVTVSGSASASPGAVVTRLEILDNGLFVGTASASGSIVDTLNLAKGVHVLSLRVTDSAGGSGTSNTVTITVTDAAQGTTVTMSSPSANGQIQLTGASTTTAVAVTGSATASAGATVAKIEVLDNGSPTGVQSLTSSISSAVTLSAGTHVLSLRVTDSTGQTAVSNAVTITVLPASTTIAGDSAAYVSQEVPLSMRAGQPYAVKVVMRNNGSTTWAAGSVYKLGSQAPQDNHIWNAEGRVVLSAAVAPGDVATFSFEVTAPSQPGTYPFVWRMVKEYVAWFGEMTPSTTQVTVVTGAGPGATLSATPTNVRMNGVTPVAVTLTGKGTKDASASHVSKLELFSNINGAGYSTTPVKTVVGMGTPVVDLSHIASLSAGVYRYKVRATDSNGVATDSAPVVVNISSSSVLGLISGIRTDALGKPIMVGWTCQSGVTEALGYVVYLDGPTPETGGVELTTGIANVSTELDAAAVQTACATPGAGHHFNIDLSSYTAQYGGRSIFVTAVPTGGAPKVSLPCNDNNCTMPGSLRIGLSSPRNNDPYVAGATMSMQAIVSGAGAQPYTVAFSFDNGSWVDGAKDTGVDTYFLNRAALVARDTPYTVQARVSNDKTVIYSAVHLIYVSATGANTVTLTSPQNGATAPVGVPFTMSATASGTGTASVKFYKDNVLLGNGINNNGTWTYSWASPQAGGPYLIKAQSFNASNVLLATSTAATLTVGAATGPSPVTLEPVNIAVPHLDNPLGGTLPGELGISNSGAATYSLALVVPPGTAGLQPALTLNYSSQGSNGMFGLGWTLDGLSSIHRCGKTIAQDGINNRIGFDKGDRLCLDGKRLVLVNMPLSDENYWAPTAEYRTELDSFARIQAQFINDQLSFKVQTKDGKVMTFGSTADSYVKAIAGQPASGFGALPVAQKSGPQSWALDKIEDRSENFIKFTYSQDMVTGEHTPETIRFGGAKLPAHAAIKFFKDTVRPDAWTRYIDETRNDLRTRVTGIKTYVGSNLNADVETAGTIVRNYVLSYETSPTSGRSLLASVQASARNPQTLAMDELPKTTFFSGKPVQGKQPGFESKGFWTGAPILTTWGRNFFASNSLTVANHADYFVFSDFENRGLTGGLEKRVSSAGRPGDHDDSNRLGLGVMQDHYNYFRNNGAGFDKYKYKLDTGEKFVVNDTADFNGDGLLDLLVATESGGAKICLSTLNNPSTFLSFATPIVFSCGATLESPTFGNNIDSAQPYLVDIVGDGRTAAYGQMDESGVSRVCIQGTCVDDPNPPKAVLFGKPSEERYVYVNTNRFTSINQTVDFTGIGKPYDVRWTAPSKVGLTAEGGGVPTWRYLNMQPKILMTGFRVPGDLSTAGQMQPFAYDQSISHSEKPFAEYVFDFAGQSAGLSGDFNGSGYQGLAYGFYTLKQFAVPQYKRAEMNVCLSTGRALDCGIRQKYSGPRYRGVKAVADFVGDGSPALLVQNAPQLTGDGSTAGGFEMCRVMGDDTTKGTGTNDTNITCVPWGGLTMELRNNPSAHWDQLYFMDLRGTGTPQLVKYHSGAVVNDSWVPDGRWEIFEPIDVAVAGQSLDRIYKVVNGLGAAETVVYADAKEVAKTTGTSSLAYPQRTVPTLGKLAARLIADNGAAVDASGKTSPTETSFTFEDAGTDVAGRESLGFAKVISKDERTKMMTSRTYAQAWPHTGTLLFDATVKANGAAVTETTYTPGLKTIAQSNLQKTYCPFIESTVTTKSDLDGSSMGKVTANAVYDGIWCQQLSLTTTTEGGGLKFTDVVANTAYRNDVTNWLIGLPLTVTQTKQTDANLSVTRTVGYDYHPTLGLLVKKTIEPGTPLYEVITTYDRSATFTIAGADVNPFGLVNKTTTKWRDPDKNVDVTAIETATYDTHGRFAKSTKNALAQTELHEFAAGTGARLSHMSINNLKTTWLSDGFGNVTVERRPDGTETRQFLKKCDISSACPTHAVIASVKDTFFGTAVTSPRVTVPTVMYLDSRNRIVQSKTWSFDGQPIIADQRYDLAGRVFEVDQPHIGGESVLSNRRFYDDLNRPTAIVSKGEGNVDLTSTIKYAGLTTTSVNPKNQKRVEVRDVLGAMRSVSQVSTTADTPTTLTQFEYEAFGNLSKTIDPNGNAITVLYDLLGRRIMLNDPDLGTSQYHVNPRGEVWKQVTPLQSYAASRMRAGEYTRFEYDLIGRMTLRSETDLVSQWIYDKQPGGNCVATKTCGQLVEANTKTGTVKDYTRVHTYDASLGRPSLVTQTISNGTANSDYKAHTEYDGWNRLMRQTYQRNSEPVKVFDTRYNPFGYLARVERGSLVLWQVAAQDAAQRLTSVVLGNGLTSKQSFNEYTGRVDTTGLMTGTGEMRLQEGYLYDAIGNVSTRTQYSDGVGGSETYGYDELNRLRSSTLSGQPQVATTYDAAGNILTKTGAGGGAGDVYSYLPQGPAYPYGKSVTPHAVQKIGTGVFSYDLNGNMKTGPGRSYTWTSFNMPLTITKGTVNSKFVYGPEHDRIRQERNDGSVEVYAGAQIVESQGTKAVVKTYWPMGAGLEVDTTGAATQLYWRHTDRLGSPIAMTNAAGNVEEKLAYDPWGKRRVPDSTNASPDSLDGKLDNRGYTGHEMLDQLDLVHMNGRVYDPLIGRFLSADPILQDPFNGQSYNRYAYVFNNPTNHTDPSGFQAFPREIVTARWTDVIREQNAFRVGREHANRAANNTGKNVKASSANTAGTNGTNGKPLSEAEMGRKIADRLGLPKYDKEADNYHQYTHSTSLCASSEKGCTTDYAATGQSYSAAPGQSGPAKPGEARAIGILGGNHILQFADKNTAVVVNITMPDHVLRDGFVVRWVGERNGEVKIYTYGEGINTNGFTKVLNHAAGWVFKYSDFGIRQQMELKMRETPQ